MPVARFRETAEAILLYVEYMVVVDKATIIEDDQVDLYIGLGGSIRKHKLTRKLAPYFEAEEDDSEKYD